MGGREDLKKIKDIPLNQSERLKKFMVCRKCTQVVFYKPQGNAKPHLTVHKVIT